MPASSVYSASTTSSNQTSSSSATYSDSKPLFSKVVDKARAKMSGGSEKLPNDEGDFERAKAKELEKQRRKEEYERLGLGDRTKFGTPGAGGWNA